MDCPSSASSVSEGEIRSGDEEKAISSTTYDRKNDSTVNTSARPNASSSRASHGPSYRRGIEALSRDKDYHFRDEDGAVRHDRSRSPYRGDRKRSRSPYRPGKAVVGEKRKREDGRHASANAPDPRRFKVHYEGDVHSRNRFARPYADLDRLDAPQSFLPYDERSGGARDSRQDRDRSRSPFRHGKSERQDEPLRPLHTDVDAQDKVHSRVSDIRSSRGIVLAAQRESSAKKTMDKNDTKRDTSLSTQMQRSEGKVPESRQQNDAGTGQAVAVDEPSTPLSEAEIIEQRRKRREAIKARHKADQPLLVQALEQNMPSAPPTPAHDSSGPTSNQVSPPSPQSPQTPQRDSPPDSPAAFAVIDDEDLANRNHNGNVVTDEEGPSAADYDNIDMHEDRPDHKKQEILQEIVANEKTINGHSAADEKGSAKQKKEFDMFADDDDDDMFAPTGTIQKASSTVKQAKTLDQSLLDNWDYPDGHYRIILGELLDGRYAVQQQIGKGTFATVVRAQDTKTGMSVAVKIACNNETIFKAGQKEMDMLQLLNQNDPDDKKHIIRLLRHFTHKSHLCLVFENLSADLREVLKKFGRNVGLNLKAIRSYAQQMFLALAHLKKCSVLHADLKPDNILVSEKRSVLKICDLGTATFAADAEVTPYLVSRFYRAPEVILGVPFDFAIDMWSVGCTLFELYTGRILFAGADNNQMLRAMQECRGKFPLRMLKRATLAERHFDAEGAFLSHERESVTGKLLTKTLHFNKVAPGRDLRSRLSANAKGLNADEMREQFAFVDLMERCLQLDPQRRITPAEALRHGFISHGMAVAEGEKKKVVPALGFVGRGVR